MNKVETKEALEHSVEVFKNQHYNEGLLIGFTEEKGMFCSYTHLKGQHLVDIVYWLLHVLEEEGGDLGTIIEGYSGFQGKLLKVEKQ